VSWNNCKRKAWGYEDIFAKTNKYCGKILYFERGWQCSLHYHKKKESTMYVTEGNIWVQSKRNFKEGDNIKDIMEFEFCIGEILHITPNTLHRFLAPYESCSMIEVSTPYKKDDSFMVEKIQKVGKLPDPANRLPRELTEKRILPSLSYLQDLIDEKD